MLIVTKYIYINNYNYKKKFIYRKYYRKNT